MRYSTRIPLLSPLPFVFLALLSLAVACGPGLITLGLGSASSGGGGSSSGTAPSILVDQLPSFGNPGLIRVFKIDVNLNGVLVEYKLNQESWLAVAKTSAREAAARILMEAGRINTLTFRASIGQRSASWTREFDDRQINTRYLYLEPIAFSGNNATLTWSQHPAAQQAIDSFKIYYGTTPTQKISELKGTSAAAGGSGFSRTAASLKKANGRYEIEMMGLLAGTNKEMKYYYFAIEGSDGSTSPIVSAHTSPKPPTITWLEHPKTVSIPVPPPKDRCAPMLVDRGDYLGRRFIKHRGPDGLADIVIVNEASHLYTIGNGGKIGGFTTPESSGVGNKPEYPIQSHGVDFDGDLLPDVVLATEKKIYTWQGDPGLKLGFKLAAPSLSIPAGNPSNAIFLEMAPGDFDGDGIWDIAASVGTLPTLPTNPNGTAIAVYIWYGKADKDLYQNNKIRAFEDPLMVGDGGVININTKFVHDVGFCVVDINRDGIDDIVYSRSELNSSTQAYVAVHVVELMQGRSTRPKTIRSKDNPTVLGNAEHVNERNTVFTDIDNDGYPDMMILRTDNQEQGTVAIIAYKNIGGSGEFQTIGQPAFTRKLGPAHKANKGGAQRGFMRVLDVNQDGLRDIVFRRIWNGSGYVSEIRILYGSRDQKSGLQDWKSFNSGVAFGFSIAGKPDTGTVNLPFSTADLNHDGAPDFCVVHNRENGAKTGTVRFLMSQVGADFLKDGEELDFSGEIAIPPDTTRAEFVRFQAKGDVLLGMQEVGGKVSVTYVPAVVKNGISTGGYGSGLRIPVVGLSKIPLSVETSPRDADQYTDLLVYRENGRVGHLQYDVAQDRLLWRDSEVPTIIQPKKPLYKLYAGTFDRDAIGDGLLWYLWPGGGGTIGILSTAPDLRSSTRALKLHYSRNLESHPVESIFVTDVTSDGLDDVIVVYKPPSGLREMWIYKVRLRGKTCRPMFWDAETVKGIKVPAPLTSLCAVNTLATVGVNVTWNQTLIAGSTEGRIISFAPGSQRRLFYGDWEDGRVMMTVGKGTINVSLEDMNRDGLGDLIVRSSDGKQHEVFIIPMLRDTAFRKTHPWLKMGQGRFAAQPTQRLDLGTRPFFLAAGQANNDPFKDILILQESPSSRERQLSFWQGTGSQQ